MEQLVAIVAVCRLATPLTLLMAHRVREQVKVQVQRNGKMKTWGGSRTQRRIYWILKLYSAKILLVLVVAVLGVKNDKSYTKNRWNICRSCGGTRSFFLSRVWDKEKYNSESSRGIKRQTFGIRALMLYHWATKTMMSNGFTRRIWHTRPAYS